MFFGLLAGFAVLERAFPRRPEPAAPWRRRAANLTLTALAIVTLPLVPVSFVAAAFWAQAQHIGLLNMAGDLMPGWLAALLTLFLRGFVSFATHWLNHKVPLLWRLHRVHHLDTALDVTSTVRFHPLEMPVAAMLGLPLIVAFGLSPWALVLYELLDVAVTLFSHANLRVPSIIDRYLRYLIVTPNLHAVHHSAWQPETDSNFSAVFPVWDLIFGTFRTRTREPIESMALGLSSHRGPEVYRVGWLLLSPLRRFALSPASGAVS
jgi:sterol desaturase/sphingolipid hydroxylase (fatty acid hydroxylase superfamily)